MRQNTTRVELHGRQYLTLCWIKNIQRPLTGPLPVTYHLILCHLPKQHHQLGTQYLTQRSVWHIILKKKKNYKFRSELLWAIISWWEKLYDKGLPEEEYTLIYSMSPDCPISLKFCLCTPGKCFPVIGRLTELHMVFKNWFDTYICLLWGEVTMC